MLASHPLNSALAAVQAAYDRLVIPLGEKIERLEDERNLAMGFGADLQSQLDRERQAHQNTLTELQELRAENAKLSRDICELTGRSHPAIR